MAPKMAQDGETTGIKSASPSSRWRTKWRLTRNEGRSGVWRVNSRKIREMYYMYGKCAVCYRCVRFARETADLVYESVKNESIAITWYVRACGDWLRGNAWRQPHHKRARQSRERLELRQLRWDDHTGRTCDRRDILEQRMFWKFSF